MDDAELIAAFHLMWDNFPGLARLVNMRHVVLAANPLAQEKGFAPGTICAKVGSKEIHRGCKLATAFKTGQTVTDAVLGDRIRGWQPIAGRSDVLVHFALMLPDKS